VIAAKTELKTIIDSYYMILGGLRARLELLLEPFTIVFPPAQGKVPIFSTVVVDTRLHELKDSHAEKALVIGLPYHLGIPGVAFYWKVPKHL
jgi:hypothetical protein